MEDNSIVLLDIETKLKEDSEGAVRDQLVGTLEEDARRVKTEMDRGLAPDEFEVAQKMKAALEASVHVVKVYHGVQHAKG
ncbi:MAG: EscE/YscE/SsaE family type III secretion system needle protein co-chaperone [Verrucomicrobiota bacterium]